MKEKTLHRPLIPFKYNNKILQKSSDVRIYMDAILLTPGEFSDAMTMAPVVYTASELDKSAKRWEENFLNVDHSWDTLDRIGYIKDTYSKKGVVHGDLHIYPITQRAKDTISLIDAGLVNWLSVEIMTQDRWDSDDNKRYAEDIVFIGCAVVTHPACENTRIMK